VKVSDAELYSFVSAALAVIVVFPAATDADAPEEEFTVAILVLELE